MIYNVHFFLRFEYETLDADAGPDTTTEKKTAFLEIVLACVDCINQMCACRFGHIFFLSKREKRSKRSDDLWLKSMSRIDSLICCVHQSPTIFHAFFFFFLVSVSVFSSFNCQLRICICAYFFFARAANGRLVSRCRYLNRKSCARIKWRVLKFAYAALLKIRSRIFCIFASTLWHEWSQLSTAPTADIVDGVFQR